MNKANLQDYEQIALKDLNSRLNIDCFYKNTSVVFVFNKKSRILTKDIEKLEELIKKLEKLKGINISQKSFILNSNICSKALLLAKSKSWQV